MGATMAGRERDNIKQDDRSANYLKEIEQTQDDALLLVKYIAGRYDRTVAPTSEQDKVKKVGVADATVTGPRDVFLHELSAVLAMTPEELADHPEDCGFLFGAIDYLSCLAKPATVDTIRLTRAYTEPRWWLSSSLSPNEKVSRRTARKLKGVMFATGLVSLAILVISVLMMAHVVAGQRTVLGLNQLRDEYKAVSKQIETVGQALVARQQQNGALAKSVDPCSPGTNGGSAGAESAATLQLCQQRDDIVIRMNLAYLQLGSWNTVTDRIYASIFPWLHQDITLPEKCDPGAVCASEQYGRVTKSQWENTELRTSAMVLSLSNYGIPLLLGFLGATAYVFRELNAKIGKFSLEPRDTVQSVVRLVLGIILGGLVGLVFDGEGPTISGFKISFWATAFLVGYSVQIVFEALDRLIQWLSQMLASKADQESKSTPLPIRDDGAREPSGRPAGPMPSANADKAGSAKSESPKAAKSGGNGAPPRQQTGDVDTKAGVA